MMGDQAAAAAPQPGRSLPEQAPPLRREDSAGTSQRPDLLYHETKWIVLKLLSCSPSATPSPSLSSHSRALSGRGNVSPRTLQTGVSIRLAATKLEPGAAECYELEVDGEGEDESDGKLSEGPHLVRRSRSRVASLTLDVHPAHALATDIDELMSAADVSELHQVLAAEASVELDKLADELKDSKIDIHSSPILTPQTETANFLRMLGDRMNDAISNRMETIVEDITSADENTTSDHALDYEAFESGISRLTSNGSDSTVAGWSSVALILAYGQRVTWNLLKQGRSSLGYVADYTTRVLWDRAANFIVHEGGWNAMSPIPSRSPYMSSNDSTTTTPSGMPTMTLDGVPLAAVTIRGAKIDQVDGYVRLTRHESLEVDAGAGLLHVAFPSSDLAVASGQGNSSGTSCGVGLRAGAGVA